MSNHYLQAVHFSKKSYWLVRMEMSDGLLITLCCKIYGKIFHKKILVSFFWVCEDLRLDMPSIFLLLVIMLLCSVWSLISVIRLAVFFLFFFCCATWPVYSVIFLSVIFSCFFLNYCYAYILQLLLLMTCPKNFCCQLLTVLNNFQHSAASWVLVNK